MKNYKLIFLFCWLTCTFAMAQTNQIQIRILQPVQNQNFEGTLSNLKEVADRLQAQIIQVNNTGRRKINLLATLENLNRSVIIRTHTNSPIELNGTAPYMFFGKNIPEFFDESLVETEGIDRNELLTGGFLPEGFYKLCVVAFDANVQDGFTLQLSNSTIGCVNMRAQYPEPPRLQSINGMPVASGMVIPLEKKMFSVVWSPTIAIGTSVKYNLKIADIGNFEINPEVETLDPNVALEQSRQPTYEFKSNITNLLVGQGGQMIIQFEENHRYAIQVQASTVNGSAVKNNGFSQVIDFWYGSKPGDNQKKKQVSGISLTAYPKSGFMPFIGMPVIVKYDPYSNDYKRFDFKLTFENNNYSIDHLGWSPNPLEAQRENTSLPNLTEEDAQYVAISPNINQPDKYEYFKTLERGKIYNWNADIWVSNSSSRDDSKKQSIQGSFTAGMGKPILNLPADKDTLQAGDINFKFHTAPDPLMDPNYDFDKSFNIVQARKNSVANFEISIKEKGILEVSDSETFTKILYKDSLKLEREFNQGEDGYTIKSYVYKDQTAKFNITKEGTYFWRVKWLKNPDGLSNSESYSPSEKWRFTITAEPDSVPPTPLAAKCKCDVLPTLPPATASELSNSTIIKIGHFIMLVTKATDQGGKTYSGEGIIKNFTIFGRHPELKVSFNGLKVNKLQISNPQDTLRAYEGTAITISTGTELLNIADIVLTQPLTLPIGLNFPAYDNRFFFELTEVEFQIQNAKAKAHAGAYLPGRYSTQKYEVSGKACMVPSGFGGVTRLFLAQDIRDTSIPIDADQFIIKGKGNAPNSDFATFVEFNCDSVRLQLACTRRFARSKLVPEDPTGKIVNTGNVEASAFFRIEYYMYKFNQDDQEYQSKKSGMIASVTFNSPFQVVGNEGWGFKAKDGYIDLSEMSNPPDMTFPEGYVFTSLTNETNPDPRLLKNWIGVYVKEFDVRIPKDFTASNRSIGLKDLIIDDTGFTVSIKGENVLTPDQAGWDFSIDLLSFNIVQTTTVNGNMKGKIGLPMFDKGSSLDYNAILSSNKIIMGKDTSNFVMKISVPNDKDIQMSIWKAQMKLDANSFVQLAIGRKNGKGTHLTGSLNGIFGFLPGNKKLLGMNLKDVKFENFGFDNDSADFFTHKTTFAFASPQHSAGGFPITINDLRFVSKLEGGYIKPGIRIEAGLGLSDLGFGADLGMKVYGKFKLTGLRATDLDFGGVDLDEVKIDKEFNSFAIAGSLKFYDEDPIFGSGFRGSLAVKMPMKIAGALTVQFGSKGTPATADYFRYWYIDGMIHLKKGIQIGALSINGFGGGAYYHMKIANPNAMAPEAAGILAQKALKEPEKAPGTTIPPSGLQFVPDKNTYLGIRAGIVGSILNAETVFNMDVSITAEFNSSGGLNTVALIGNGYLLQDLDKRDAPPIKASLDVVYDNQNEILDGDLKVMVNFYDVLYGSQANKIAGDARFHVDNNQWYFYVGTASQRLGLKFKKGPLSADMTSYFMAGYGIPSELPPLPEFVTNLLNNPNGKPLNNRLTSTSRAGRSPALYQTGQGIAFGSSLDVSSRLNFLVFYAQLRLVLGFDLNITKNPERVCANGIAPGHKGWYGQGQAYAGIEGSMGIHVDLWFVEGDFEIAKVGAAISMVAKLPNPEYFAGRAALNYSILRGAVKGHCNFNIELGENCIIANNSPLSDLKLITDMQPSQEEQSPLVNVSTSFMFPMNQIFEIEEIKADNTVVIRKFQPFIKRYQLFEKLGNTKILVQDLYQQLELDGSVGILKHTSALKANTNYFAEIEVQLNGTPQNEPNSNQLQLLKDSNNNPLSEIRNTNFKTGPLPQTLVDITESWPIQNQRFFLQNEGLEPVVALPSSDDVNVTPSSVGKKGYIKIGQQDYLFKGEYAARNSSIKGVVKYEAVFTPVDGSSVAITTPMKYFDNDRAIEFDIPQLANSTTYRLDIVRTMTGGVMSQSTPITMAKATDITTFDVVEKTGGKTMEGEKSTKEITKNKLNITESNIVPPILTLFSYQFRTSKYNNHRDKFGGNTLIANNGTSGFVRTWRFSTNESFESSDFANSESNVYRNGQTPLIQTSLPDVASVIPNSHQKFSLYRVIEGQFRGKHPYVYIDNPARPDCPYYATSGLMSPLSAQTGGGKGRLNASDFYTPIVLASQSSNSGSTDSRPTIIFNDITDKNLYRRYDQMAKKIYTINLGFSTVISYEYNDAINSYRYVLGSYGQQRFKFIYWVPTKAGSYPTAPIQYETTVRGGGN